MEGCESIGAFGRVLQHLGEFRSIWKSFGAFVIVLESLGELGRVFDHLEELWSVWKS